MSTGSASLLVVSGKKLIISTNPNRALPTKTSTKKRILTAKIDQQFNVITVIIRRAKKTLLNKGCSAPFRLNKLR